MSKEKTKKITKSKKLLKKIPLSKKINGISLNFASEKNFSQISPHILDLNKLIKKQEEKKNKAISLKNYFKETLYNFWINKKIQKLKETEEKNNWRKNEYELKLIINKITDLPKKIKVKLIDLKLSLSKRKMGRATDFTTIFHQKPATLKQKALGASKLKKERRFFTRANFNELAIINLIQFLGFLIISCFKLIKLFFLLLSKIIEPLKIRIAKFIPSSFKEKFQVLEIKLGAVLKIKPPEGWYKALASFVAISFVLALPLQALTYYEQLQDTHRKILDIAARALNQLKSGQRATTEFNLESADKEFKKAENSFLTAQNEINQINLIITSIIRIMPEKGKTFESGEALIKAGKNISEISQSFTEIIDNLSISETSLTDKIILIQDKLKSILPEIEITINDLAKVNIKTIPEDNREAFLKIRGALPLLKKSLDEFLNISNLFLEILGEKRTKRYLFLFQNNNEIRPTGGFLGSFALIDIDRGKIKKMEVPSGGSYDLKGNLKEKVISPEPLHLVNPHWQFQDANWFADFPTSAKKIIWFYEKSGGPSVDGVIAINATLIKELLKITGPIEMPKYNKIIDDQNFLRETQKAVEIEYENENKPKQFIADLAPKLIDKILNLERGKVFDLILLFQNALQNKDLIFYSTEPEVQQSILKFGWGGEIKFLLPKSDYLFIVNANVGGGKTDLVIKQKIKHQSDVLEDGSIIDNLTITRTHEGERDDPFTGIKNIDYLRVYVPEGSVFLEAKGFEKPASLYFLNPDEDYKEDLDLKKIEEGAIIDPLSKTIINNEFGRTVFANWIQLEPGETKTVILRYKLPFKLKAKPKILLPEETWLQKIKKELGFYEEPKNLIYYTFLLQKQPGAANIEFSNNLNLPKNLKVYFKYPPNLSIDQNNKLEFTSSLESDEVYGLILKDNNP